MIPARIRNASMLVAFACSFAAAATYHVASSGDDSRTVADAQSASTPWKTLNRLDSVILHPGDPVLSTRAGLGRFVVTAAVPAGSQFEVVLRDIAGRRLASRSSTSDELASGVLMNAPIGRGVQLLSVRSRHGEILETRTLIGY